MKITIRQWPVPVPADNYTILDSALSAGVPYPHGCRSGECGACKTRLLAGKVEMAPHDVQALSSEDEGDGMILACRARPATDIEIAWIGDAAAFPIRHMKARVAAITQATHDISILHLEPETPLAFAAGQFVHLRFGRIPVRSYSMANRPDEQLLEFHIRLHPEGLVSRHVRESLKVGDTVKLEGPYGAAYLRDGATGPILAAAGGTGFAPIRSIIRSALHQGMSQPIHLYLGFRDRRDIYGADEVRDLVAAHPNLSVTTVLSDPSASTDHRTGLLHEAMTADALPWTGAGLYVAGPPPMVDAVRTLATSRGLAPDDIHADPFTPAASSTGQGVLAGLKRLLGRVA